MAPKYDLDKIKYATDTPTFEKAVAVYESGEVKNFEYILTFLLKNEE